MGAALGWGIADYSAALSSRRIGVFWTMLGMQVVGTLAYAAALLALGRWPALSLAQLPYAVALAVLGFLALLVFYRALALGPIAVVSPIAGAYLAVAILLIVAFLGERLSLAQTGAVGLTFAGVVLASTDLRTLAATVGRPLPGVGLAVLAMLGFGAWAALLAQATRVQDGLATVLLLRVASVVILAALALGLRSALPARRDGAVLALVVTVGLFDTLANVLYVLGVQSGHATIVATGSGVYPVVPALLAITVLGERLAPNQYAGVALLVAGLVALGLQTA
ncbi:MAG: DMT family transporter [Candidatus Limnocylindria bacterium]